MKVFIADDYQAVSELLELWISCELPDCEIRTFPDGLSVIEAISACDDPDCWLITDYNMPGATGDEVIRAAKHSGINPQRIILMTGYGISEAETAENASQASELGIKAVVVKPDIVVSIINILKEDVPVATT